MKFLKRLQQLLTGIMLLIITLSILTWLGVINPFASFEKSQAGAIKTKLSSKATEGDADAQNKLGTLLYTAAKRENGDFTQATQWFKLAAEQKHPIATMNLGFAYKAGNGVEKNEEQAIQQFYKAGLLFLEIEFPMDAKDSVHDISTIDAQHPRKADLIKAIKLYETSPKK